MQQLDMFGWTTQDLTQQEKTAIEKFIQKREEQALEKKMDEIRKLLNQGA